MQQDNNTNWFATSMQEAYPPTQPSRKRSRIFKIVVIAACILLLVGGGSAGLGVSGPRHAGGDDPAVPGPCHFAHKDVRTMNVIRRRPKTCLTP